MNDEHQLTPEQWTAVEMCAKGCYGGYLSDWPVLQSALRVLCPDVPPAWCANMGWVKGFCFGYMNCLEREMMSSRDDIENALKSTKFAWEATDGRLDVWPRDMISEVRLTDPDELPVWLTGYSRIEAGLRDEVRWRACLVGAKWLERASFDSEPVMVASYELEVIDDGT